MKNKIAKSVEEYISSFPEATQQKLKELREAIQSTAPKAAESISYAMPAYKYLGKPLVYFAGYDNHIGFYGTPSAHTEFAEPLSKYKQGKGSVQFPLDKKLPLTLIKKMVKFKISEADKKVLKK